jgi:hypothetical protein
VLPLEKVTGSNPESWGFVHCGGSRAITPVDSLLNADVCHHSHLEASKTRSGAWIHLRNMSYGEECNTQTLYNACSGMLPAFSLHAYCNLPYFFGSMDALKAELPSANFSHWWRDGGLSKADQRRIVITKIPMEWESQLRLNDSTHTLRIEKSIDALVDYLTTIENVEKLTLQKQRARTMAHNRRIYEGRGRNTQRDFRRQNYYTRGGSSQQCRYNSGRNIYGSADPHFRYQGQRALT